ncbi:DUF2513 domain-containing protein [Pectinatus frisingensis]|uniref:DUF2513 domain-containing protein n=1 Tax=Pectinatus frisingensis TaxID=865 RepID=UPI0018C7160A|nr:DUF2513 domain-containing protein [Pectinatus frisingensis]
MRRDLDLIREMLIKIELADSNKRKITSEYFSSLSDNENKIIFHIELLIDAGFIEAVEIPMMKISDFCIKRLTFDGCDYLDSIRDENIWEKTKNKLKLVGSAASLEVVQYVAIDIAKKVLGI